MCVHKVGVPTCICVIRIEIRSWSYPPKEFADLSFNCFNERIPVWTISVPYTNLIEWFTFRWLCSSFDCLRDPKCLCLVYFPTLLYKHFTKATYEHTKATNFLLLLLRPFRSLCGCCCYCCLQQLVKIVFIEKTVLYNVNLMFSNFQQMNRRFNFILSFYSDGWWF